MPLRYEDPRLVRRFGAQLTLGLGLIAMVLDLELRYCCGGRVDLALPGRFHTKGSDFVS